MHRNIVEPASQPKNNRLFVLGGKGLQESDWEGAFSEYGDIRNVKVLEEKGIAYITFSKASEAFHAQEKLTGQKICGLSTPIKVLIATEKGQGFGNKDTSNEDEQYLRLFIKISKSVTKEELDQEFTQWGEVDNIKILTHRDSGESKGLAFVSYYRRYHAALALENCPTAYRAMFAQSQGQNQKQPDQSSFNRSDSRLGGGSSQFPGAQRFSSGGPVDLMSGFGNNSMETDIEIMTNSMLSQQQLHRLADLFPGLDYCELNRQSGIGYARYNTSQCAAYAKEKLMGFEYPLGHRLGVRYPAKGGAMRGGANMAPSFSGHTDSWNMAPNGSARDVGGPLAGRPDVQENISTLLTTIQQATQALQAAGVNTGNMGGGNMGGGNMGSGGDADANYCSIQLPPIQPMAHRDDPVVERLFIVSQPSSFPEHILQDCLCRFGGLIGCYFMPGKNFGYAKFADKDSAEQCMNTMHGQEVCSMRLKVIKADPPRNPEALNRNSGNDYDSDSRKKFKS